MKDENENELRYLQRLAEDVAYTFKGLYKTSDWLRISYKLFLVMPIIFSIVTLAFDVYFSEILMKVFAVLSMFCTFWVLLNQKEYEKIDKYHEIANEFKKIYDELEMKYYNRDLSNIDEIREKVSQLRFIIKETPISLVGRIWAKKVIHKEMSISWFNQN